MILQLQNDYFALASIIVVSFSTVVAYISVIFLRSDTRLYLLQEPCFQLLSLFHFAIDLL